MLKYIYGIRRQTMLNMNRGLHTVTLIPGDGIGNEISGSVVKIFKEIGIPIEWETVQMKTPEPGKFPIPDEVMNSIHKNKICLKGPLATPVGKGHRSLNLALRKSFQLYANLRPCKTLDGLDTGYQPLDVVIIRENTEGEYSGLEHEVIPGVVQSIKLITRTACIRVAEFAFEYARRNARKFVTVVHKANVMKKSDGLFLKCCQEVSKNYSDIQLKECNLDLACFKLVKCPSELDVIVTPNLYGDIVSDLGAGLIGGLGLTPSGNIGLEGYSIFEAVHGSAPDIAGKNIANPTALLLSSIMMLKHLNLTKQAESIERCVFKIIKEKKVLTRDLGGSASTSEFTEELIKQILADYS